MDGLDSTQRGRATQKQILQAVVDRLIDYVDDYNTQNCFVSDQAVPSHFMGGRDFCTVSPGSGRFPTEFFTGAGTNSLVEDATIVITPGMVRRLDKPHKKDLVIVDLADSLVERKRQVLAAMVLDAWEPAIGTQPLTRDMLSPVSATAPGDVRVGETEMIALQLTFSTVFDWLLEGDGEAT